MKSTLQSIINELTVVLESVDDNKVNEVVQTIIQAPRIFVAGAGRSGLMVKAFAMRLMHAGLSAYVIGDVTTPSSKNGDVLLIATGSGETGSLISYAKKARKNGLKIITITSFLDSTLGRLSDVVLQIQAPTPKSEKKSKITSKQPMGSLFEQSLLFCLDGLIIEIMRALKLNPDEMFKNHSNIE